MTNSFENPAKLTKDELLATLQDIVAGFKSGDTLEGNIEFLMSYDEVQGCRTWDVKGAYRTGNLTGQGGMILIHE